eukprot:scaffold18003_cov146-Isochrysis_galbana.AAC.1
MAHSCAALLPYIHRDALVRGLLRVRGRAATKPAATPSSRYLSICCHNGPGPGRCPAAEIL